mmetsp:Transcript_100793/g.289671  ORF Transcript_100793/g.289671 Transcript_100793/m.289671 type:complete len:238 (+) Transcript_100793:1-714(+)
MASMAGPSRSALVRQGAAVPCRRPPRAAGAPSGVPQPSRLRDSKRSRGSVRGSTDRQDRDQEFQASTSLTAPRRAWHEPLEQALNLFAVRLERELPRADHVPGGAQVPFAPTDRTSTHPARFAVGALPLDTGDIDADALVVFAAVVRTAVGLDVAEFASLHDVLAVSEPPARTEWLVVEGGWLLLRLLRPGVGRACGRLDPPRGLAEARAKSPHPHRAPPRRVGPLRNVCRAGRAAR